LPSADPHAPSAAQLTTTVATTKPIFIIASESLSSNETKRG
jgi:hypothetical protein